MSTYRIHLPKPARRPEDVIFAALLIIFGAGGAAMAFGPPEQHIAAVAITAAFCVGCFAVIVYAFVAGWKEDARKNWEQTSYELIGSRLIQHPPGWPVHSVDLANLTSAVQRGSTYVLSDKNGYVAFHAAIDGRDEILAQVTIRIERRSSAPRVVIGVLILGTIFGSAFLFEFRPGKTAVLVFMALLLFPTAISISRIVWETVQRKSENEK